MMVVMVWRWHGGGNGVMVVAWWLWMVVVEMVVLHLLKPMKFTDDVSQLLMSRSNAAADLNTAHVPPKQYKTYHTNRRTKFGQISKGLRTDSQGGASKASEDRGTARKDWGCGCPCGA